MPNFPAHFLWGAATSAHQVEGNNGLNDWWEWECKGRVKEPSGNACRHYELFEGDFDLARSLNHNAHRFSLEWSRLEPQEGVCDEREVLHYAGVVDALRARSLEPVVTLHHFTNPLWFASMGGWVHRDASHYYLRYVERIVSALCEKVHFWVTINEPLIYLYFSYIVGSWPPGEKSIALAKKVADNLVRAHRQAYTRIHEIYREKKLLPPMVSIAHNMQAFEPCVPTLRNKLAAFLRTKINNLDIFAELSRSRSLDFLGINYYSRQAVELEGWALRHWLQDTCRKNHSVLQKNSLGWDIYPQGFSRVLAQARTFKLPVFILENGICTDDDRARWEFINTHLQALGLAIAGGLEVIGYLYWSLIDNFEWDKGFAPRFGLIHVDYNTFQRTIRESARQFAQVCKTGTL
jgi:beta-glucosidase